MNSREREKPRRLVTIGRLSIVALLVTLAAGAGALGGSVLGSHLGRSPGPHRWWASLLAGAAVGGVLGVALGIWLAVYLGAIPGTRSQTWPALAGGIMGFVLAIPIATHHLNGPLIPIASALLPGIGTAMGSLISNQNSTRS